MTSYTSTNVFGRFCVPTVASDFKLISQVFSKYSVESYIESLTETKNYIFASIGIALVISFLFSWFLEKCAGVVVTISIVGFYAGAGYLAFIAWKGMGDNKDSKDEFQKSKFKLYKGLFGTMIIIMSILSCMICCFWSRLVLATKIISAAAEFVTETKRIVFVPIVMLVITCGYLALWTMTSVYILSTAEYVDIKSIQNSGTPFVPLDITKNIKNMLYFHGFGLFWNIAFLLTASNFIITGATCLWYHRDNDNSKNLLITTVTWMLKYHIGTLAFGSFILAVIWTIRVIVEYIDVKTSLIF